MDDSKDCLNDDYKDCLNDICEDCLNDDDDANTVPFRLMSLHIMNQNSMLILLQCSKTVYS